MAARKVSTPGAPEKAPEPVSTVEQSEAALEHITGNDPEPEAPQDQSTNETSSVSEPVKPTAEEQAAKKEYEEFLQWRKNKGEAVKPVKATAQPIQSQGVLTDRGWDSVEE